MFDKPGIKVEGMFSDNEFRKAITDVILNYLEGVGVNLTDEQVALFDMDLSDKLAVDISVQIDLWIAKKLS